MNTAKILKGQAQLIVHLEDAAKIARRGGNTYIAATRDGLRGNRHYSPDAQLIEIAIGWIQSRVAANSVAHKARQAEAQPEPNLILANELSALAATIRQNSGIGGQTIDRCWGQALKIGGKAWHQFA